MKVLIGFVVGFAIVASLAAPAFATECTSLMEEIEERLANATISEAQEQKAAELLEQGAELHEAGEHDKAVAVLKQALGTLGM